MIFMSTCENENLIYGPKRVLYIDDGEDQNPEWLVFDAMVVNTVVLKKLVTKYLALVERLWKKSLVPLEDAGGVGKLVQLLDVIVLHIGPGQISCIRIENLMI